MFKSKMGDVWNRNSKKYKAFLAVAEIGPTSYLSSQSAMQAFFPFVRIGSPTPSAARECCFPTLWVQGGDTRLREKGWGDPILTKGQTLWYSMYTI